MVRLLKIISLVYLVTVCSFGQRVPIQRGFFPSSVPPSLNLLDGLIAYYTAEEASGNLIDVHATYDLTLTGTWGSVVGKVNNARTKTDTNSFFLHPDDPAFEVGTDSYTIAFWCFLSETNTPGYGQVILSKGSEFTAYTMIIGVESPYTQWFGGTEYPFQTAYFTPATTITTNTWYFFCLRVDQAATQLQFSVTPSTTGTLAAFQTDAYDGSVVNTSEGLMIGGINDGLDGYRNEERMTDGSKVDELGFWRRKLTDAEVSYLYNAGSGRTYSDF
jgi:hypothetical protein